MAEDLPDEFDVVVIGTGMPESILAAAFSRIGQSVLHIDRNAYYSGQWASFSLKAIEEWIEASQILEETKTPDINVEGEQVLLHSTDKSYSQQKVQFHIRDPEPEAEEKTKKDGDIVGGLHEVVTDTEGKENSGKDQEPGNKDEVGETESENKDKNEAGVVSSVPKDGEHVLETSVSNMNKDKCERKDSKEEEPEESSPNANNMSSGKSETSIENEQPTLWTVSRLRKEWRKFNLDLSPKLLYCGGSMVELLITSDIAKYCEFKTVSRILTLIDGKLRRVPCSRADVFSSKDVSMIEKRMMMKFLTFCVDFEKHEEDYKEFAEKPYKDFLEHQKLSKNVIHFIQNAISMTSDLTPTAEGLKKTQKFLHSLGRYGNTAFLWPLYGSGEMPQSFCRMCAVFGGVYCLRTPPASLVISPDNICTGVVMVTGKHIKCKRIVMENSYAPEVYIDSVSNRLICRGILVTDRSILSTEDAHQLSLLRLPGDSDTEHPTTLLELPATSMVCPPGLYAIHLTKEVHSDTQSPEEVLQPAVNKVFQATDAESPKVLWSLYYQQKINNGDQSKSTPTNVILVPGPGPEIDIDHSVTIAREIFEEIMPGEDFLPRPPNPEDIIFVDEEETQVAQDSEKTEFNETSQDTEESTTQFADTENDQSNKNTEPKITDILCESDLTHDSSNNSKVDEISESVETCRTKEK